MLRLSGLLSTLVILGRQTFTRCWRLSLAQTFLQVDWRTETACIVALSGSARFQYLEQSFMIHGSYCLPS